MTWKLRLRIAAPVEGERRKVLRVARDLEIIAVAPPRSRASSTSFERPRVARPRAAARLSSRSANDKLCR